MEKKCPYNKNNKKKIINIQRKEKKEKRRNNYETKMYACSTVVCF